MKAGRLGAGVSVLDSRVGIHQDIVNQERYQRLPLFVSAKKVGFLASVKEQNVVEDELEVWIGLLIIVCPASVNFRNGASIAHLLNLVYHNVTHPFRVEGE